MSPQESPYYAEIADFVAAVREGRDARVSPADGIEAVARGIQDLEKQIPADRSPAQGSGTKP